MNNKEYILELSQRTGYTQDTTQKLVRSVVDAMAKRFDEGDSVAIPSFGTFELRSRMERIVVNPLNGQRLMVPPKVVLNFKPSTSTKERINKTKIENE